MPDVLRHPTNQKVGEIVCRPASRIKRCVQSKNIEHAGELLSLANAIRIILGMQNSHEPPPRRVVKFRLPVATLLQVAAACASWQCSREKLYEWSASYLITHLRCTNLIDCARPNKPQKGPQVKLRNFNPYHYRCLRLVAYCCKTSPSAVMD